VRPTGSRACSRSSWTSPRARHELPPRGSARWPRGDPPASRAPRLPRRTRSSTSPAVRRRWKATRTAAPRLCEPGAQRRAGDRAGGAPSPCARPRLTRSRADRAGSENPVSTPGERQRAGNPGGRARPAVSSRSSRAAWAGRGWASHRQRAVDAHKGLVHGRYDRGAGDHLSRDLPRRPSEGEAA